MAQRSKPQTRGQNASSGFIWFTAQLRRLSLRLLITIPRVSPKHFWKTLKSVISVDWDHQLNIFHLLPGVLLGRWCVAQGNQATVPRQDRHPVTSHAEAEAHVRCACMRPPRNIWQRMKASPRYCRSSHSRGMCFWTWFVVFSSIFWYTCVDFLLLEPSTGVQ